MAYNEQAKADLSKERGKAAAKLPHNQQKDFIKKQGDEEQVTRNHVGDVPYTSMSDEADKVNHPKPSSIPSSADQLGSTERSIMERVPHFKHGTDNVKSTGLAVVHKGEAVLKKEDASKYRATKDSVFSGLADELSGSHEKSKKEVKEIRTRKAKNGGYIHEHHHTHPADHPMEEHTSPDQDAMAGHMLEHMGEPNPGEAEANAGQSGIEGMNGNVGQ